MKLILSRTPVSRICEILDIGSSTYYNKLEWIYRRCLEFLDKFETKQLSEKRFDSLWLNTDKFTYVLNNIRKKGHGKKSLIDRDKPLFPTIIVATTDSKSRYVFRADASFDYSTTIEEIKDDIDLYKDDKLYSYLQKTSKYKFSKISTDENLDYEQQFLRDLEYRKEYVDGLHMNSSYTTYAHHWLLNNSLNVDNMYLTSDEDASIISVLLRVYKDRIINSNMHIFTCRVDKNLSKKEAFTQYIQHKNNILKWRNRYNNSEGINDAAIELLSSTIDARGVFKKIIINGKTYTIGTNESIEHPYPYKDEGNIVLQTYRNYHLVI